MTDRTVRELLAEAYDTIVPPGAEHALWRVRVKRALAKEPVNEAPDGYDPPYPGA